MSTGWARETSGLSEGLEQDTAVIYVLDENLRIVYCNEAWDRFAAENGGSNLLRPHALGVFVIDVIPPPLKRFFEKAYREALSGGQMWQHSYDCSSPGVYRKYLMQVHSERDTKQLVVVHSIVVEANHSTKERQTCAPNEDTYADRDGIVTMCCECRRTCRATARVWDWVPAYVERPPEKVSHGICDVCLKVSYSNGL